MSAQNVVPIRLVDVEISEIFELLVARREKLEDSQSHRDSSPVDHECLHKI